jgi:hypothetical protein
MTAAAAASHCLELDAPSKRSLRFAGANFRIRAYQFVHYAVRRFLLKCCGSVGNCHTHEIRAIILLQIHIKAGYVYW